jgi:2-polyprenyl-6-methoxyphenol hydroxylase-like FAD-dependent oxidoreductase
LAAAHDTTVMVIGGGIAGLTASIALRQQGIDSIVYEQADDLRKTQLGSGLFLGFNVTRAFKHLELFDEFNALGAPIRNFQFETNKGKVFGFTPEIEGEASVGIIRPVFHEFLVRTFGLDNIQLGAKLVRFEQDDGGVTGQFADGRTVRAAALIGADGLKSTVRTQLHGESEPRHAGYATRRGIVETEAAKDGIMRIMLGRGERLVSYPVGKWWVYWTAATNEQVGGGEEPSEIKRTVLERFRGWSDLIEGFVEATDDSNTFFADTLFLSPFRNWGEGRVTLLGDSAHAMTWDRGQGASQGIEGALLLAKELAAQSDDPAAAFRAWEALRYRRTAKMVRSSRMVGKLAQSENPLARILFRTGVRIETTDFIFKRVNRDLLVEY